MSWPTELRVNPARDALSILFDDGARATLAAEKLRVESPSAEVRAMAATRPPPVTGKQNVKICPARAGGQLRRAHRVRRRP